MVLCRCTSGITVLEVVSEADDWWCSTGVPRVLLDLRWYLNTSRVPQVDLEALGGASAGLMAEGGLDMLHGLWRLRYSNTSDVLSILRLPNLGPLPFPILQVGAVEGLPQSPHSDVTLMRVRSLCGGPLRPQQ